MTKKHFIALAQYIRTWNNGWQGDKAGKFTDEQIGHLASFCQSQNSQFNRSRWLGYIAGTNGPNGGQKVKYHEFYVDLPAPENLDDGPWVNVATFDTREEAIAFAKEHFGADDEGRVCLVSGSVSK